MPEFRTDDYGSITKPQETGFFSGLKGLVGRLTRDSVMEPGFIEAVTAEPGTPIDYDNISSVAGGRAREMFVEPLKNASEAIQKGMSGKRISIKDLLALTELNLDLAAGTGFTAALGKKGLDPSVVRSFPAWHGSPHNIKGGKFLDKAIGTGEGVQAFGRGHYLTDLRGIARRYSKMRSKPVNAYKGQDIAQFAGNPKNAKEYVLGWISESLPYNKKPTKQELLDSIDEVQQAAFMEMDLKKRGEPSDYGFGEEGIFDDQPEFIQELYDFARNLDPKDFDYTSGSQEEHLYKTIVHRGKDPSEYEDDYFDWHQSIGEGKVIEKLKATELYDELKNYLKHYKLGQREQKLSSKHVRYKNKKLLFKEQPETPKEYLDNLLIEELPGRTRREVEAKLEILQQELADDARRIQSGESNFMLTTEIKDEARKDWPKKIEKLLSEINLEDFEFIGGDIEELTGQEFYEIVGRIKTKKQKNFSQITEEEQIAATKALKDAGFAGHSFDAGTLSGGAKPGTKNYVIYDPEDIYVKEHYIDDKLQGIKTYHGSPHDIKHGFKDEAIGTGEGMQNFARGHYSSEGQRVANQSGKNLYQTTLHKGQDPSKFDYMSWDTTINLQNSRLNDKIKQSKMYKQFSSIAEEQLGKSPESATIREFYRTMQQLGWNEKEMIEDFKNVGISGVTHNVGISSAPGKSTTKNYINFDPKDATFEDKWTDGKYQHKFDPRKP